MNNERIAGELVRIARKLVAYGPIEEFAHDLVGMMGREYDFNVDDVDERQPSFTLSGQTLDASEKGLSGMSWTPATRVNFQTVVVYGDFDKRGLTLEVEDLEEGDTIDKKVFRKGASDLNAAVRWLEKLLR